MLLHIVARGRIGRSPEAEMVDRYVRRIGWPVKLTELGDAAPTPAAPERSVTILLDEAGDQASSREIAARLDRWREEGVREARFLIGAADGHDAAARAAADWSIAFGRATWPHLMARAMIAEQLWRATSMLAGHPYHRDG